MNIDEVIRTARDMRCSDIHISVGLPMMFRVDGHLQEPPFVFTDEQTEQLIRSLFTGEQAAVFDSGTDVDFAYAVPGSGRQRVNVFRQQGAMAATIRLLNDHIPSLEELHLPPVLEKLAALPRGLVLVTGPTGSGKSTTLAAMMDYINRKRTEHILTIEDPIEYVYQKKQSLIHQRELGRDVSSFAAALRSALREDPDIILVGEMRDYETISAVLTAAETGHLVLSTLHTTGVAQTIDRIIDTCPGAVQGQVRVQLSGVLKGIVTQCLIPLIGGGRIVATEVLTATDAVLNMIREDKCHQLKSVIQSGASEGMHTLNMDLSRYVRSNKITQDNAFQYTYDKKDLQEYL